MNTKYKNIVRATQILLPFLIRALKEPYWAFKMIFRSLVLLKQYGWSGFKIILIRRSFIHSDYLKWIAKYDILTEQDREKIRKKIDAFPSRPLISVLMPVYDPSLNFLEKAIQSVRNQIYQNWEFCICDDASKSEAVRQLLQQHSVQDPRIKVVYRAQNGHISQASNSALEIVKGEFIALLDHDDLLAEHALFWVADTINKHPNAALIYSDEDKVSESGGRIDPYFKCDWNPELFLGQNLISHLGVYRTDITRKIEGFRIGFEGSQDYDLAARFIEQIDADQIVHIPRILYHWRSHDGSTAKSVTEKPYAMVAGEKALNQHLERRGVKAKVTSLVTGIHRLTFQLPEHLPLVSIIIPTHNALELVRKCVSSIYEKTNYKNYEIILVDNRSDDPHALQYFKQLTKQHPNFHVLRDDQLFNCSRLYNLAVKHARGELVALLHNDIEVITPEWLSEMISIAIQSGIGAVGAKLLYSNNTVQHAGVILGLGGCAGHGYKGFPSNYPIHSARLELTQNFSAVTGACLVVSKKRYHSVGGLNESSLGIIFNDIDFCLKLRKAGYRNVWTPFAQLYHHESMRPAIADTIENVSCFNNAIAYMKATWGDWLQNDPAYSPNLTLDREDFGLAHPPRIKPII